MATGMTGHPAKQHNRSMQQGPKRSKQCAKSIKTKQKENLKKTTEQQQPNISISLFGWGCPSQETFGGDVFILCILFFSYGFLCFLFLQVFGSCVHIHALKLFFQKDSSIRKTKKYYRCIFEHRSETKNCILAASLFDEKNVGCFQCAESLQINTTTPIFLTI